MKILHIGDVHLGVELHGRSEPGKGYGSRTTDFLAALDRALSHAADCELVLFCGDVYHQCSPPPTIQREFAIRLRELTRTHPVVIIPGNHDLPSAHGRASSIDIFHALELPNLWVLRTPTVERIPTRAGDVLVAALPFLPKSKLLATDELRGISPEEANLRLSQVLAATIDLLGDQVAAAGRDQELLPCVLMAHYTVEGASYGGFRQRTLGSDIEIPLSALSDPRFDYVALAHIHQHQAPLPHVVYPGSIERIDFGEEVEEKVVVLASIEYGSATWETRSTEARSFRTLKVAGETAEDICRQLAEAEVEGCVVRAVYTLPVEEPNIPDRELRQALQSAHYVAGVKREASARVIRTRQAGMVTDLAPLDALTMYLDSKPELAPMRESLLSYGTALIEEVTAQ